jgi:hypothetical protein
MPLFTRSRKQHRIGVALAASVAVSVAAGLTMVAPAARGATAPRPVDTNPMADPGVVALGDSYVVLTTHDNVNITSSATLDGPWPASTELFTAKAPWAADRAVWAPDAVYLNATGTWVVYFASHPSPSGGVLDDGGGRCIGAASAPSKDGPWSFVDHPLVCPAGYGAPDHAPLDGVIGPAPVHITVNGDYRLYLTYKVQSTTGDSKIRMVRLTDDGLDVHKDTDGTYLPSHELVHSVAGSDGQLTFADTIEAPSMVQVGTKLVLFTAKGAYDHCTYDTGYYVADVSSMFTWDSNDRHVLLTQAGTGICGPGTGDLTFPKDVNGVLTSYFFFDGWTNCDHQGDEVPCDVDDANAHGGHRSMYIARITWNGSTPVVSGFVG